MKTGETDMAVFIVEDSAPVRERLVEMVSDVAGMRVVGEAGSYREAVSKILAVRPDVAILDIKLAGEEGTGIEVLAEVKRHLPNLLGIVLSNYATPQHGKASADAGATWFLDKTTEFEQVVPILEAISAEKTASRRPARMKAK